ncbi:MAG: CotH kinase family protein [Verrucomicrobiota bacterium]|nr:CotH kinase family protein [Verrucomicrobiota bacterium]
MEPVLFETDSGYFTESFTVVLSCPTPDAVISYTVNGSDPRVISAARLSYSGPISISQPTVVRAVAEATGLEASAVETRTYLFPALVGSQGANQTARGMPATWATLNGIPEALDHRKPAVPNYTRPADYAVDNRVVQSDPSFVADLQTLPVVSLVLDPADLFSKELGMYANSSQDWARPAAIEWLDADGVTNFRATCEARILGDLSRRENENVKHGFMVKFDADYGPTSIANTIFADSTAEKVNRIALRSVWGDSWLRSGASGATLLRDQFAMDSFRSMGQIASDGRFVNVYVNGLYWGVYQAAERPEDNFLEERTGIKEEQWDVMKGVIFEDTWPIPDGLTLGEGRNGQLVSGTTESWDALFALANGFGSTATNAELAEISELLDLDNFIDYMILNMYAVNWDWPQKNWYAASARNPEGGAPLRKWIFLPWDTEAAFVLSFQTIDPSKYTARFYKGPALLWRPLWKNAEFAVRFGDRLQKHYFGTGGMTATATTNRFTALSNTIDRAIFGESARWGDYANANSPYTRTQWLAEINRLKTEYFPARTDASLNQFKSLGLYPSVTAPVLAHPGGLVESGFTVALSAPAGTIYFTTDGSDPRLVGGTVNPAATAYARQVATTVLVPMNAMWRYLDTGADAGAAWRTSGFNDSTWATGLARLGYGGDGEATQVSYGGNTQNRYLTTYFRSTFELTDPASYQEFRLNLIRDDGAVVYLNGAEIIRSNMPEGAITYQTKASANTTGVAETQALEFIIPVAAFVAGTNTLAIEVHQDQPTSSDLGFALSLNALKVTTQGMAPLTITTTIKARVQSGTAWSALSEAVYRIVPTVDAGAIIPTEIHFKPAPPSTEETLQNPLWTAKDFEFIELQNVSDAAVQLLDLQLATGIRYSFTSASGTLEPQARIVLASNSNAFLARYGFEPLGEFSGNLSNDADTVDLYDGKGGLIFSLNYAADWLPTAAKEGTSLTLLPKGDKDRWMTAAGWTQSVLVGGSPGQPETELPADPIRDVLGEYTPVDGGFSNLPWLGLPVWSAPFPWVFHWDHGWLYAVGSPDSIWFFDAAQANWWWTTTRYYPFVFFASNGDWMYYDQRVGELRRFYNMRTIEELLIP